MIEYQRQREPRSDTINMEGKTCGYYKVLGKSDLKYEGKPDTLWDCQCICGKFKTVAGNILRNRKVGNSCGCRGLIKQGDVFGRLTALDRFIHVTPSGHKRAKWNCRCSCGDFKAINANYLHTGHTRSCGCYAKEVAGLQEIDRVPRETPRSIYIAWHPSMSDYYKIGIAINPKYRTRPKNGGLTILDSVELTSEKVCELESNILTKTKHLQVFPKNYKYRDGFTEWRQGEETVRIWHEQVSLWV